MARGASGVADRHDMGGDFGPATTRSADNVTRSRVRTGAAPEPAELPPRHGTGGRFPCNNAGTGTGCYRRRHPWASNVCLNMKRRLWPRQMGIATFFAADKTPQEHTGQAAKARAIAERWEAI